MEQSKVESDGQMWVKLCWLYFIVYIIGCMFLLADAVSRLLASENKINIKKYDYYFTMFASVDRWRNLKLRFCLLIIISLQRVCLAALEPVSRIVAGYANLPQLFWLAI